MARAKDLVEGLDQGRHVGRGRYTACCPAHDDRNPSLSIRESEDGKVLVKCFSGCDQRSVIDALRQRGLWTPREMTAGERREFASRQREIARQRALEHHRIIVMLAESDLRNGGIKDSDRAACVRSIQRVLNAGDRVSKPLFAFFMQNRDAPQAPAREPEDRPRDIAEIEEPESPGPR